MVKVKSNIPAVISAVVDGADNGLIEIANDVTNQAKAYAQFSKGYQTGQTRAGLMWVSGDGKQGGFEPRGETKLSERPAAHTAIVGVNNDHALYLEKGTRRMDAQPFLGPAVDVITKGESPKKAMADAMKRAVKRAT